MNRGIVYTEIPADDPRRAADFYAALFGWKFSKAPMDGMDYWMFEAGGLQPGTLSGGGLFKRQAPGQGVVDYVAVESLDDSLARALELGGEQVMPRMEIPEGYFAQFKDLSGNVIGIFEPKEAMQMQASGEAGHGIVHFEIPSNDPQRAADFYTKLFGWTITKDTTLPDMEYLMVSTGVAQPGVLSGGGIPPRMSPGHVFTNYVNVESADATSARVAELGGSVILPKMPVGDFGFIAQFLDTEGNVIAVWENAAPMGERAAEPAAAAAG